MKYLILSALIIFAATSCNLQEKRTEKCRKWGVCATTDSVSIIETVKFDTIVTDDSKMWIDMLFECDSLGNVFARDIDNLESENADLKLKLKDNRLVVYVKQPNDTIYIAGKDRTEYIRKNVEVPVNYLTFWQELQIWGFRFSPLIYLLLYLLLRRIFR